MANRGHYKVGGERGKEKKNPVCNKPEKVKQKNGIEEQAELRSRLQPKNGSLLGAGVYHWLSKIPLPPSLLLPREVRECLKLDPDHKHCFSHYKQVKKLNKQIQSAEEFIKEER